MQFVATKTYIVSDNRDVQLLECPEHQIWMVCVINTRPSKRHPRKYLSATTFRSRQTALTAFYKRTEPHGDTERADKAEYAKEMSTGVASR
jgi:hypothetical protein